MIEWGLGQARKEASKNVIKALWEKNRGIALTAVKQIAALDKIQRATQEILQEFGVPDIPLATEQEKPQVLIEHSPTGRKLDIVQKPDPRAELRKLGLSVITHNLLVRADCVNVEGIVEMTDEELMYIRNFGERSLRELKAKLTERLSGIREERRLEKEKVKKNNRDPKFHVEKIAKLVEDYARALARRQRFSLETEEPLPTDAEIFERAIEQHIGKFGFFTFREEDLYEFKAHMIYRKGVGEISTRQGLSTEERMNLYLHFLAHIALEHENQADSPDISERFEGADKKSLFKTTLREEKEADKWVRSFTEAIVARTEQRDVELEDSDDNRKPPKKPKPQPERSITVQKRLNETRRVILETLEYSNKPMSALDLLNSLDTVGCSYESLRQILKSLREANEVRFKRDGTSGYIYSYPNPSL